MTSNEDGYVSTSGLLWEVGGTTYYFREISAPGGYDVNNTIYTVFLSGTGVSVTTGENEEGGNLPFTVENRKTPPDELGEPEEPEDPEEPGEPDEPKELEELEEPDAPDTPEGDITVEGLTVLAFTGYSFIYYIIGLIIILIGATASIILFRVQRKEQ
ncbi:MAG: hypothetical protein E3J58_02965 [Actinomycetota bacterium]|nr:MAG: hypothetical protein E3J58_02965 [Actinomycetota bacterium]